MAGFLVTPGRPWGAGLPLKLGCDSLKSSPCGVTVTFPHQLRCGSGKAGSPSTSCGLFAEKTAHTGQDWLAAGCAALVGFCVCAVCICLEACSQKLCFLRTRRRLQAPVAAGSLRWEAGRRSRPEKPIQREPQTGKLLRPFFDISPGSPFCSSAMQTQSTVLLFQQRKSRSYPVCTGGRCCLSSSP